MSIQSAQWEWDQEGLIPRSTIYDDVYHSRSGGVAQAREVFVKGSGFPERWQDGQACTILETGFGLGLNFLTTWNAWRQSGSRGKLHYLAVECYPWQAEDLAKVWSSYAGVQAEAQILLAQWMLPVSGFHRLVFDHGSVVLTLALGDVRTVMREWLARVDAFYLDGFSPDKNPEMWDVYLFKQCARLACPGATITTYTVAGAVRRALTEAGFVVEKVEGFGGKRHRLAGYYRGFEHSKKSFRNRSPVVWVEKKPRRIAVVGAGIAGCSVAERLALRGVEVDLFDSCAGPAQQTSGNRAGVIYPLISQDNNRSDRITRAAYLWWHQQRERWEAHGLICGISGVMQLAKTAAHAVLQESAIADHAWPLQYVEFLDVEKASEYVGYQVEMPGWWFPQGGWINPLSLCQALLAASEGYVQAHWNTRVQGLRRNGLDGWTVETSSGAYDVDQVVLANAWESARLLPEDTIYFKRILGQTNELGRETLTDLKAVVCQDGYVIPPSSGYGCMGATYEWEDMEPMSEVMAFKSNAERVQCMLPSISTDDLSNNGGRSAWRTSAKDRLPIVGSLQPLWGEDGEGLWGLLALGSRGLVWAPWTAEVLASACCGEPLPLERCLWDALAPDRFRMRSEREGFKGTSKN